MKTRKSGFLGGFWVWVVTILKTKKVDSIKKNAKYFFFFFFDWEYTWNLSFRAPTPRRESLFFSNLILE